MIEIMLYGRGGQGVVTAGELLVKAAIHKGIYGQSIPFFGGERRGAPVYSYVRIDNKPVRIHRHRRPMERNSTAYRAFQAIQCAGIEQYID